MKNRRPAGMEPIAYRAKLFWILLTLAIYGFLLGSMSYFLTPLTRIWCYIAVPMTVIALYLALYYLPALHRSMCYLLDDRQLLVQGGIFFHKKQVMNREQIVYVSVVKTPAYYLLGTCTLLVQAAGAQIVLGWLPKQKANALLYRLSEREEGAL